MAKIVIIPDPTPESTLKQQIPVEGTLFDLETVFHQIL